MDTQETQQEDKTSREEVEKCVGFKKKFVVCKLFIVIAKLSLFIWIWVSLMTTNVDEACCGWVAIDALNVFSTSGFKSECTTANIQKYGFVSYNVDGHAVCYVNNVICNTNGDKTLSDCDYDRCPSFGAGADDSNSNLKIIGALALIGILFNLLSTSIDVVGGKTKQAFTKWIICCDMIYFCCIIRCGAKCKKYYRKLVYHNYQLCAWGYGFVWSIATKDIYNHGVGKMVWISCENTESYPILGDYSDWLEIYFPFVWISAILTYIGIGFAVISQCIVFVNCCSKNKEKKDYDEEDEYL